MVVVVVAGSHIKRGGPVNRVLLCKAGAHVGAGGQVERGEALPRDELHAVEAADLGFGHIVVS